MRLSTGCEQLDSMLGGGLEPAALTLVFGEAGTGKTNLCLQLAREAVRTGRGKIAYVDSEGVSFERLQQICGTDYERVTRELLFFKPTSLEEQARMISALDKLGGLGLIAIDSLNMHYRLGLATNGQDGASRTLTSMLGDLFRIARQKEIPIIVTGQVYTADEGSQAFGGRIMEHIVKAIVRFERVANGVRRATLLKHRSLPEGVQTDFRIAHEGLVAPET